MLQKTGCERRRSRLQVAMAEQSLDAVVLAQPQHVYWASGYLPHWLQQAAVAVTADGRSLLVAAAPGPKELAVDEVRLFQAAPHGTQRSDQPALAAAAVIDWLRPKRPTRVGFDTGAACVPLLRALGSITFDAGPLLHQLRRVKEEDELLLMQKAIECSTGMYKVARAVIKPGARELDIFCQMHHAAVLLAGEPMTDILGNDFASGVPGGPARANHFALPGQLYILDLGPSYRGYFADNAQTFSVDRNPTPLQLKTAAAIYTAFALVEAEAKPGVRCRELHEKVDQHLRDKLGVGLPHHLGHGVGLEPHEYPHLDPDSDDVLLEGEVFAVEPGVYSPQLNGGIRVENQYLVTHNGVRNLTNCSTSLI